MTEQRIDTATVIDSRGRKIEIRKTKPLDRMRLMELVGPENAKNGPYLGYAGLAYSVVSIDGSPMGRPSTKLELETIVQELDDDGIDAVADGINKNFLQDESSKEALKNE
jgi:hypothetical protein